MLTIIIVFYLLFTFYCLYGIISDVKKLQKNHHNPNYLGIEHYERVEKRMRELLELLFVCLFFCLVIIFIFHLRLVAPPFMGSIGLPWLVLFHSGVLILTGVQLCFVWVLRHQVKQKKALLETKIPKDKNGAYGKKYISSNGQQRPDKKPQKN